MANTGNTYPDIYFEPEYARLYETADSRAVEYRFSCEYGEITDLFLKRSIPILLPDGTQYYDIITPYGYGGPVIHHATDQEKLISAFLDDFQHYTAREHIVAEFVRFHPIIGNGAVFRDAYHAVFDRKTVGTNLRYDDVIGTEFSKHKRKEIRRILRNPDLRYEIEENPRSLDDFVEIYYSTMDRDGAGEYYYFPPAYFQQMLERFPGHITTGKVFLGDRLIAMGVYFRYGKYLHAHLSGTLSEYLEYSPAYILKYALALYGHEKGYAYIHYGGGSSPDPDNGLYRFKREFGKNTEFDFYLAKKVWNEQIYQQLCDAKGVTGKSGFFPAYREQR